MASQSSSEEASGFSIITCRPHRAASTAWDAWAGWGVQMLTASTPVSSTISRIEAKARTPYCSANSCARPMLWLHTAVNSLFGSCASAGEYDKCLELIAAGKVDVDAILSAAVPLEQGAEWIEKVYNHEPGLYKIVLTME